MGEDDPAHAIPNSDESGRRRRGFRAEIAKVENGSSYFALRADRYLTYGDDQHDAQYDGYTDDQTQRIFVLRQPELEARLEGWMGQSVVLYDPAAAALIARAVRQGGAQTPGN
jgi:hypothetical protein